ncbi:mycolyltransferase [Rhodococcus spelaei]|uniref:Mycolyltransferase n=1 Tax=Rhodococcus spelaei TaxID=2546320 RepID=A0A541BSA6_9NOCA|nr:mycolyltransferase [Rhodococcus spelaei]
MTTEAPSTTIMTPNGDVTLSGPILERYTAAGGPTGSLGVPLGPPEDVGNGGKVVHFTNGAIYSTAAGPAYVVQGEILRVYTAQQGPTGTLGFPTGDEKVITGGWESTFEHGTIKWVDTGNGVFVEQVTQN